MAKKLVQLQVCSLTECNCLFAVQNITTWGGNTAAMISLYKVVT